MILNGDVTRRSSRRWGRVVRAMASQGYFMYEARRQHDADATITATTATATRVLLSSVLLVRVHAVIDGFDKPKRVVLICRFTQQ